MPWLLPCGCFAPAAERSAVDTDAPPKKKTAVKDPKQNPARIFGPNWQELPANISGWDRGMGKAATPRFHPPRNLMVSERAKKRRANVFWRTICIMYALIYGVYLMPVFRFGGHRLTLFEHLFRKENVLAGEMLPLALKRAKRAYRERNPQFWHPLATLPPGAALEIPSPVGGEAVSGVIEERREFREPKNMRQWTLYVLQAPVGADPECLLVAPRNPGDWKRVEAWTGRLHASFTTEEPPFAWPPGPSLSILGAQGWPAEYALAAASWPKAKLDPMNNELEGIIRRIDDPPGRQYSARPAAFWTYQAIADQKHPPFYSRLDIFLIQNHGIFLESNAVPVRAIEFDLAPGDEKLLPIVPESHR